MSQKEVEMPEDCLHSLVEIQRNDWETLLELYAGKKQDPAGYSLIKNYINWIERKPDLDIKYFSLDGDWKTDGTYILIVKTLDKKNQVHFNTLDDNLDRLSTALCCLRIKQGKYNLYDYRERLVPAVDAVSRKFPSASKTTKVAWYTAKKELVEQFSDKPPTGITLRNLEIKEASIINDLWPHRSDNSLDFVKRLISYNISVGAYDAEGQLLAWCLRLPMGCLGLLQVRQSHRCLGLGSLVVRYLSKRISELGEEVLAPVVTENTPSRKMFEKLGFQQIDNVYWTNL